MSEHDAPFRELFVELPRALFESLQAIGEAAVAKAGGVADMASLGPIFKAQYAPGRVRAADYVHLMLRRYGWTRAESRRLEWANQTRIIAGLPCGHSIAYDIDDLSLLCVAGPAHEVEVIDDAVDREPRQCYCVPRSE